MSDTPRTIYCRCAYAQIVPDATKNAVLERLADSDQPFECVSDLCEMSARRDPIIADIANGGPTRIAACYPRAVKGLFRAAGNPLPEEGIEILNMRTTDPEVIAEALEV